jgi:hypothetical protein
MAKTPFWGALGMTSPYKYTPPTTTIEEKTPALRTDTPIVPYWLPTYAPGEEAWGHMQGYPVKTPSGQLWNKTLPSWKSGLQSYINYWAGRVPGMVASYEDLLSKITRMLPQRSPSRAGYWGAYSQG